MTWYASHIYAEAKPSLIEALRAHPSLSQGLYKLVKLKEHRLPKNGLIVVRELCDPESEEGKWHRPKNVISWHDLQGVGKTPIIQPPYLPEYGFGWVRPDLGKEAYPPLEFLRYLKQLSSTHDATVGYYHHRTGAERAVDQEFAWIFGAEECVYVSHVPNAKHYTVYTSAQEGWLSESAVARKGVSEPLITIMEHFGIVLKDWYFAPHTRSFAWDKYKV